MQVTTTDGITITLSPEQIAEIDRQVKLKAVPPVLITDRVKTWEDAYKLILPRWYLSSLGSVKDINVDAKSAAIGMGNVSSQKRILSLMAYAQLSVIADALNEGWEPDWTTPRPTKYVVIATYVPLKEEHKPVVQPTNFYRYSTVVFRTEELAQYAIDQFPDLWRQYFMID